MVDRGNSIINTPNIREYPVPGDTMVFTRTDPYGWWFCSLKKAKLPEEYRGPFTTIDNVQKAVALYRQRKGSE
jgi:hypothetical protein